MNDLLQDIRYSLRRMARAPGTTLLAILALGLAAGANAVIFSVVQGVLLRPLPFPDAASLFLVFETQGTVAGSELQLSVPTLEDWRRRSHAFAGRFVRLTGAAPALVTLRGQGEPESVKAALVGADFFPTLGVTMRLGRGFGAAEDDLRRPVPAIVLSEELWKSRFAADPAVLGRSLRLGDTAVTVIGVAPAGVQTPGGTRLWAPLSLAPVLFPTMPGVLNDREMRLVHAFGRVAPGQDRASARRDLAAVQRQLAAEYPATYRGAGMGADLIPLRDRAVRKVKTSLLLLQLAVGLVLLMATANLSSLALARGLDRGREISIRVALGVRRSRVVRQVLTESVLLSLSGGAAGLLLARWGLQTVLRLAPAQLPYKDQVSLDATVVLVTLAAASLAGLLAGLLPAWKISAPAFSAAARPAAWPAVPDPLRSARLQGWLVGLETGLAVLLLIATGLLVRSFLHLHRVPLGFEAKNVLALSLSLPADRYADPVRAAGFYQQALERLAGLPGVVAVGAASDAPLEGITGTLTLALPPGSSADPGQEIECLHVSPGYFKAIGATLLRGRAFTPADLQPSPRTLIINQTLAARLWPGGDPIGRTLLRDGDRRVEVVGVVADVRHNGLADEIGPAAYEPALWNNSTVFLRTAGDPRALAGAARRELAAVDSSQAPYRVDTLEDLVAKATSQARFNMLLFSSFGAVALVLGASGIFGLLSLFVIRRRREIGIRMALGARREDVLRQILGNGMRLAGTGIAAALVAGFWLTRWMAGMLFEISTMDAPSFVGAAVLMSVVAFVSCALPAWRASRLEPVIALRGEA